MITKHIKAGVASCAIFLAMVGAVEAATIDIVRIANNLHNTVYGIRDNTGTEGVDLAGAVVTAAYADGTTEEIIWQAQGLITDGDETYMSIKGWADGEDAYLFMSWDGIEVTTTRLMTSLSINLVPASSVFDTTFIFDHEPPSALGSSTPGSSFGGEFSLYPDSDNFTGTITATYSGIVSLNGAAPAGDLFTTLTIDLSNLSTGGLLGDLNFHSDMDTMRYAGDLTPVPLPASLPLLLISLGGLSMSRRITKMKPQANI